MHSKTPVLLWLSASCLVSGSFLLPKTEAVARNTNKQQLIKQMAEAQITAQKDNEKLKAMMQGTLEAFKKYCHKTGAIPQSDRHVAYLEQSLSQLAGINPFNEFPYRIAADDPTFVAAHDTTGGDRRKTAIRLRLESTLDAARLADWRKNHQPWLEMPGTITILHDGHNACCLWGAGVDGAPIKGAGEHGELNGSDAFLLADDRVVR